MPSYSYRCRSCGDTFDLTRPMAEASAAATCPQGHDDAVKLLTTVGVLGVANAPRTVAPQAQGGGCCG